MSRYAAFLRAMNVGGHRLTNAELQRHFEELGLEDVRTFRASGNVVFDARRRRPDALRKAIEHGLAERLGYAVPTFVRSAEEMARIAAAKPFAARALAASAGKLQVGILRAPTPKAAQRELAALAGEQDRVAFEGCELYWLPSGGVLDSALDMQKVASVLGEMTMRTKATVEQLAAKHFDAWRRPGWAR
jgi:uncharacterized protein (DUF1697 family)